MILAVDAGNSNIVLGCMDGLEVRHTMRLITDRRLDATRYTAAIETTLTQNGYLAQSFEGAILSSVVAARCGRRSPPSSPALCWWWAIRPEPPFPSASTSRRPWAPT